jgi:hypothetical protein
VIVDGMHSLVAVPGLSDDFDIGFPREQRRQPLASEWFIVNDQSSDFFHDVFLRK